MPNLEAMQHWADRQAQKVGVDVAPLLRWAGDDCKIRGQQYAHCHIDDSPAHPRGTICVRRSWAILTTLRGWHDTITHEVVHLRVKDHNSLAFAKWMQRLGYADQREKDRIDRNAHRLAMAGHRL